MNGNRPGGKYDGLPELQVGEPYFILRGRDVLAPLAIETYSALLRSAAAGVSRVHAAPTQRAIDEQRRYEETLRALADEAHQRAAQMIAFQADRGSKLPD